MDEGDLKELRELVEFLKASSVAEFDMERPDLKVRLKFSGPSEAAPAGGVSSVDLASLARLMGATAPVAASPALAAAAESVSGGQPSTPAGETGGAAAAAEADEDAGLHIVKSPLVGTFYDAPSPGADTFVKIGDSVGSGQVLCIVEAMKIMNEIESDAAGQIAKVFVKPGQPVEYGQKLFAIRAS